MDDYRTPHLAVTPSRASSWGQTDGGAPVDGLTSSLKGSDSLAEHLLS